jgi:hypothetical protein
MGNPIANSVGGEKGKKKAFSTHFSLYFTKQLTAYFGCCIFYISDDQLAARWPDPARGLLYSGPRQVSGLF